MRQTFEEGGRKFGAVHGARVEIDLKAETNASHILCIINAYAEALAFQCLFLNINDNAYTPRSLSRIGVTHSSCIFSSTA